MNTRWHEKHVLSKKASLEERLAWHREHQKQCACRPIPAGLLNQAGSAQMGKPTGAERRFARIAAALKKEAGVTVGGKGFGSSGLRVHGKLFSMISSKGLFVAKLPRERVSELVQLGKGEPFDPRHGRLMKEWLAMDGGEASWLGLAREAYRFVGKGGGRKA